MRKRRGERKEREREEWRELHDVHIINYFANFFPVFICSFYRVIVHKATKTIIIVNFSKK